MATNEAADQPGKFGASRVEENQKHCNVIYAILGCIFTPLVYVHILGL